MVPVVLGPSVTGQVVVAEAVAAKHGFVVGLGLPRFCELVRKSRQDRQAWWRGKLATPTKARKRLAKVFTVRNFLVLIIICDLSHQISRKSKFKIRSTCKYQIIRSFQRILGVRPRRVVRTRVSNPSHHQLQCLCGGRG